jgi:glycerol-3-phosphate acyltransferase PlsY
MNDLVFHKADLIYLLAGYLLGSIPLGYWLGKLKGIDLTKEGSGSTGATNVLRKIGKVEALITLLFDIGKGFFSAYLVMKFNRGELVVLLTSMACIIGHSKSIFLGFKGGKSSATGLGILIAICWQAALITFLIWLLVVYITKYSSMGSIVSVPLSGVWIYLFSKSLIYTFFAVFASVYIVLIRHRENIQRLLNGTEPKIGGRN